MVATEEENKSKLVQEKNELERNLQARLDDLTASFHQELVEKKEVEVGPCIFM